MWTFPLGKLVHSINLSIYAIHTCKLERAMITEISVWKQSIIGHTRLSQPFFETRLTHTQCQWNHCYNVETFCDTDWNKPLAPLEREWYHWAVTSKASVVSVPDPESRRSTLAYLSVSITTLHHSDQNNFSLGERLSCQTELQKQTQYELLTKMHKNCLSLSSSAMRNHGLLLLNISWVSVIWGISLWMLDL